MEMNLAENLQTRLGKNYQLTWINFYSNFRFCDGHQYLARNYAFKILSEEGGLFRFTVAMDEVGIATFERVYQRPVTPGEQSDIAKHQIKEAFAARSSLEKNNLAEVRPDLLIQTAQYLGIK